MIEIKNLTYKVLDNIILNDVNLILKKNKIYCITGPNGSGKSTLLKIIMGIIKPTSGQVLFNGKDINNLSINERAKLGISYAFQQPITFTGLKIKDILNVASNSENKLDDICKLLSKVGLCAKDYIDRPLDNKLSGGELKRIEIATMLARNADVNILDEPEAGIDLWSFNLLTNLFKSKKTTNIIVSHQRQILDIADEIIVLKEGKVLGCGNKSEVAELLSEDACIRLKRGVNE